IYTLSLHDALPIWPHVGPLQPCLERVLRHAGNCVGPYLSEQGLCTVALPTGDDDSGEPGRRTDHRQHTLRLSKLRMGTESVLTTLPGRRRDAYRFHRSARDRIDHQWSAHV